MTEHEIAQEWARIDRDIAEAGRLHEETRKFVVEALKMDAGRRKMESERRRLDRAYRGYPWLQTALTAVAAIAAIIAAVAAHH